MKVYCLNKISPVALNTIKSPNIITDNISNADCILVRSQSMHDLELNDNILAVARAGAGVNNIPIDKYTKQGIAIFNTPGANANAVKELTLCGLFLSSREILKGCDWIEKNKNDGDIANSVEKVKVQFAGHEILGKTIAVIGLGSIGKMVANSCLALGMKVRGYDPYLTSDNAIKISQDIQCYEYIEDAIGGADYVTIHVPLTPSTKGMINKNLFDLLHGAVLLNFSRDALIDDDDLLDAINDGRIKKYVTDFANSNVIKMKNTIIIPHLGASTEEAEDNCAFMAIDELDKYIEYGSTYHSVNFPDVDCGPKVGKNRICVFHESVPNITDKIVSVIDKINGHIINSISKIKGEYTYSVFDVDCNVDICEIVNLFGVIRVRVL